MRCTKLILAFLLLLGTSPAFAAGVLSSAASSGSGLPAGGDVDDCVINTGPGAGEWAPCPGAAGGDSVSVDGAAVTDPNFDSAGDIDFVNNSNVITANVKANSVALGTDTTGNYATSASEGGPASTALALDANPTDCSANQFANAIGANGNLTCAALVDADIPNDITITLAAAATALAANPTDCSANQFANAIAASGNLTCGAIADADVPDTITVSNYLLLAGGTLTGQLITDNLGIEFAESDTNPTCASGNFNIYADLSENTLKKCINGVVSVLDTGGAGGSSAGGSGAVQTSDGAGAFVDSGCTASSSIMTCNGGFVAGISGAGLLSILEGTVVSAGASAGVHNCGFDSSDSLWKCRENGGSLVTFLTTANPPTTVSGNAGTATALASNPTDCSANQFANTIAASGNLTCAAIADADVPDTITVSNYLPLAGGTLTGALITDNLGITYVSSDTNPTCGAGEFKVYADLSELKLKKCMDSVVTDMDTAAASGLASTDIDTSAEIRAIVGDESGTGALLFAGGDIAAGTATTPSANDNDTSIATTAYVQTELTAYASDTVTFTNKTLTAPIIATISNTGTVTLPTATDTLMGKATTDTMTNKTMDVEGTGNVFTTKRTVYIPAAGCNNATAGPVMNLPATAAPSAACVAGTNTHKGVLEFDATTDEGAQFDFLLPSTWVGAIDARILWKAAATAGATGWCVQFAPVADAETDDPAFIAQGAGNCVSDTVKGTTLQTNIAAITGVTITGVAAGELLNVRISRDANGGAVTDDMTGDALLIGVELTYRETL